MFQELLITVKANISTVHSIIKTNDKLRKIAFGEETIIKQELDQQAQFIISFLMEDIPKARDWRVYDHCSAVTRLYAIYERFIEELISEWLVLIPGLFPRYLDLDQSIRNTHQIGVGRLLCELNKNRYEHLSIEEVVRGLFRGVTGEAEYELLADAFLFHEQNLRQETLEKLFANADIPNAWAWVVKHRAIKYFIEEIRGNQNTVEGELNELISYRNDAAHGSPIDDLLGLNALLELCDFIEALCQALAELVTYQVIERKKSIGQAREIGKITEWFKKPKAAVAKIEETILSVGESLFLVGEAYCLLATIQSIQIDGVTKDKIQTTTEMELGLKFDVDARKELRLYQLRA
ncbi:MAE_28990/MAE_18760 family HEPN-like nuclease [Chlorogloeopsis sp. ULAP01]|uniref:MAE_28990/MAE_18760 family HEPN-like nuclease n=1 Tax=Chlorogloeopsis sp. ULAP01 TaxID=3056483 RepID=UPI0025AA561D|nr:MAE_28990/MAE_18760 family HEPN-like nuclease [Chlorogloeopsis sp. ULAP01]MDM9385134.1 MAE_28990/MAE_18760 family HEPN-like nuclease [Chlorogloeopsis sp. ULAP01]